MRVAWWWLPVAVAVTIGVTLLLLSGPFQILGLVVQTIGVLVAVVAAARTERNTRLAGDALRQVWISAELPTRAAVHAQTLRTNGDDGPGSEWAIAVSVYGHPAADLVFSFATDSKGYTEERPALTSPSFWLISTHVPASTPPEKVADHLEDMTLSWRNPNGRVRWQQSPYLTDFIARATYSPDGDHTPFPEASFPAINNREPEAVQVKID